VLLPDLKIATFQPAMQGFSPFLAKLTSKKDKPLSAIPVRSYKNYALSLPRLAVDILGWSAEPSKAEAKWEEALGGIKTANGMLRNYPVLPSPPRRTPVSSPTIHLPCVQGVENCNGRQPQYVQESIKRVPGRA